MKRCKFLSCFAYAALLVFGCSLLAVSCKDDDNENGNGAGTEQLSDAKDSEQAMTLLGILQAVADIDTLPDNWSSATFEPTVGYVLSEAQPYVRSIAVENASEAAAVYANLTDKDYNASLTSDSWSLEGVGSLTYKLENKSDVIATIDCQLKQVPHLTQLRLVKSDALGENASSSFTGEAHYNFGDVVFDTEEKSYWICVRPALQNVKGDSHWFSFDLQDSNYKTYEANPKKDLKRTVVPTKLGKDVEMMGYLMNLLSVIANPNACADYFQKGRALEDGLGNLGAGACSVSDVQRIAANWQAKGIWNHLPVGPEYFKQGTITVFYHGYSSKLFGGGMSIYGRNYTGDAYSQSSKADFEWDSYQNMAFDAHCYAQTGYNSQSNQVGPTSAIIVRYRSSKDFDKKADPLKSFDEEDYENVYRSRSTFPHGRQYTTLGDVFRDKTTGATWFTLVPSNNAATKKEAFLASFDKRALGISADGNQMANAPGEYDAFKTFFLLDFQLEDAAQSGKSRKFLEILKEQAHLDVAKLFTRRDSTYMVNGNLPSQSTSYCACVAYKDKSTNTTKIMRGVVDNTRLGSNWNAESNQDEANSYIRFFKHYSVDDKAEINWRDVMNTEKVSQYAQDEWTRTKLHDAPTARPYRSKAETADLKLSDYVWSMEDKDFYNPTLKSMFNDHIMMFAVRYVDETVSWPSDLEPIFNTTINWEGTAPNGINSFEIITDPTSPLFLLDGQVYHPKK